MELKYQDIILRDMEERDIEDERRWNTVETEWAQWDAPWETERILADFDVRKHRRKCRQWIRSRKPEHRLSLEIETSDGVHIGSVGTYCIDRDFEWKKLTGEEERTELSWAVGLEICESGYWSRGLGTQALTALVRYHLKAGYTKLYTQTWSGNVRMVGLAKKLGFVECFRKAGDRQVRGEVYDSLTFRLDEAAFRRFLAGEIRNSLELHIPTAEDMWFVRQMQEDPDTMAYNAGWDVSYEGYHPDTGCIDFPESEWEPKRRALVGHEPNQFYALVRETHSGAFVGEVNFHPAAETELRDMGVVIHAPFRGLGYGRGALELLLDRAFRVCGIPGLRNSFEPERDAGLAIHLEAGFRETGTEEAVRFGKPIELRSLLLTREQYEADRGELCFLEDPEEKRSIVGSVLGELPEWFGLPESTAEYVERSGELPFWAIRNGETVLGFAALKATALRTAEIYVMGVRPQYHRTGTGRRLFGALYAYAKERGYRFLQVKTVHEGRYAEYDLTHAFYRAMGFTEFECFPALWDTWNPCQVLVMAIL